MDRPIWQGTEQGPQQQLETNLILPGITPVSLEVGLSSTEPSGETTAQHNSLL
jgi:hypothetical protein